jgi:chromate reductase, NAD(P)H dehydrogenase (quinone)
MPDPILVIAGTNRPDANALKIARIVMAQYKVAGEPAELYSLSEMPREIFDPSAYATKPAAFLAVQNRVVASAGLHIICPEYNGSFPGVLKYFIDMLKFPESFERKPVAFTGEAAGIWGALRAVEQLQAIFGYRNAYLYPERVFIPGIGNKLDKDGNLMDNEILGRLTAQARGFAGFVKNFAVR